MAPQQSTHLANVEFRVGEELDERGDDVRFDDGLDLLLVSGGDVGDGPARLLADALLGRAQQVEQPRQRIEVDDHLRLKVIAGHDVPDGAQGRRLYGGRGVYQQLHQALAHPGLDHRLDLVVLPVRQVAQGPARVRQDLLGVGEVTSRHTTPPAASASTYQNEKAPRTESSAEAQ